MKEEIVLITGASRGIGRTIAELFAERGYTLALVSRTLFDVEYVASTIVNNGGNARAFVCDIGSSEQVDRLIGEVKATLGDVTILINNAGVAPSAKLEATSDQMWSETFATNVSGAFLLSRAVVPGMRSRNRGQILSIASTAALHGYAYTAAYTASKHALLGLTRALAVELQRNKIAVNALCPGFVRTDIVRKSIKNISERSGKSEREAEEDLAKLNSSGRLIEPEEVAALALQVIEWPEFRTGKAILMDGTLID
jgi:NAD(P)-dependent dehydrogenase (short-subunit alcohol dehydrogenase family)